MTKEDELPAAALEHDILSSQALLTIATPSSTQFLLGYNARDAFALLGILDKLHLVFSQIDNLTLHLVYIFFPKTLRLYLTCSTRTRQAGNKADRRDKNMKPRDSRKKSKRQ